MKWANSATDPEMSHSITRCGLVRRALRHAGIERDAPGVERPAHRAPYVEASVAMAAALPADPAGELAGERADGGAQAVELGRRGGEDVDVLEPPRGDG